VTERLWGFKSPLAHWLLKANALVEAVRPPANEGLTAKRYEGRTRRVS
jgi:hypothetical protein